MILSIDSDQGLIKAGVPAAVLPGILDGISINGNLLFSSSGSQGGSGTAKVLHGWDDATITITLLLVDTSGKTRYDHAKTIVQLFRSMDSSGAPAVITILHAMISAWGGRQFLFETITIEEVRGKKKLVATLKFTETNNISGLAQDRRAPTTTTAPATVPGPVIRRLSAKEAQYGSP